MKDNESLPRILILLSRGVYAAVAIILFGLGVVLAGGAVVSFLAETMNGSKLSEAALNGIGYVVVAVAVFEIARHLIQEEVVPTAERDPYKAKRSLARLISTVAVAIFLEALVVVFHAAKENVPQLIYPALLLVSATLIVVGLGVFQRLTAGSDNAEG